MIKSCEKQLLRVASVVGRRSYLRGITQQKSDVRLHLYLQIAKSLGVRATLVDATVNYFAIFNKKAQLPVAKRATETDTSAQFREIIYKI